MINLEGGKLFKSWRLSSHFQLDGVVFQMNVNDGLQLVKIIYAWIILFLFGYIFVLAYLGRSH